MHIFTQWGWLILFSPNHFSGQHQIRESPPNYLFLRTFSNRTDVLTVHSLQSSSISTPWGKPSNLWTSWVYSLRPRVPSWIWIRCIQSATHRNAFISPLTLAVSAATQNSPQTSSYFIPGQHFLETFMLLFHNNQDHTFMGDNIIPDLNQQAQPLLHPWRPYLTQTFYYALSVAKHISLKHLAAKIPSQLHNYFFPSFVQDFPHKGTLYFSLSLNLHKNFSISWFFSPSFTTT